MITATLVIAMNASAGDPTDGDSLNCDSPDRRYKTCMILYSADVPWRPFGIFLGLLADGRSIGWIFDSDFGGEGGVGVYSTHIGLLGRFLGKLRCGISTDAAAGPETGGLTESGRARWQEVGPGSQRCHPGSERGAGRSEVSGAVPLR